MCKIVTSLEWIGWLALCEMFIGIYSELRKINFRFISTCEITLISYRYSLFAEFCGAEVDIVTCSIIKAHDGCGRLFKVAVCMSFGSDIKIMSKYIGRNLKMWRLNQNSALSTLIFIEQWRKLEGITQLLSWWTVSFSQADANWRGHFL